MIPHIIHYCWFGKREKPQIVMDCIDSWKKFMPDFEIREWNETNFDVNALPYVQEAYFTQKYAFVSDVARIQALVTEGGIYLDTDVMILKRFPDEIMNLEAFIGFEDCLGAYSIATAVIGSEKNHPFFLNFLRNYQTRHFLMGFKYQDVTNVEIITKELLMHGLVLNNTKQEILGTTIFPNDYFCNMDFGTKIPFSTESSLARHLYLGSWKDNQSTFLRRRWVQITRLFRIIMYKIFR